MVYMVPQWLYPTNEAEFLSDLINCFNNLNSNIARQPPIHYMNIWNVVALGCTRKIIIGVIRYPTSSPITIVTISISGFVFFFSSNTCITKIMSHKPHLEGSTFHLSCSCRSFFMKQPRLNISGKFKTNLSQIQR